MLINVHWYNCSNCRTNISHQMDLRFFFNLRQSFLETATKLKLRIENATRNYILTTIDFCARLFRIQLNFTF